MGEMLKRGISTLVKTNSKQQYEMCWGHAAGWAGQSYSAMATASPVMA